VVADSYVPGASGGLNLYKGIYDDVIFDNDAASPDGIFDVGEA
jgi:hypothetical protein